MPTASGEQYLEYKYEKGYLKQGQDKMKKKIIFLLEFFFLVSTLL